MMQRMREKRQLGQQRPGLGISPGKRRWFTWGFGFKWGLSLFILLLFILFPLRRWITYRYYPDPQAIIVLGGDFQRTRQAVRLAQRYPHLPIVISDLPRFRPIHQQILDYARIDPRRITYDTCATDTLTNFTCLVDWLHRPHHPPIHHVYLVTSDYHMARAQAIASIVLSSQGMVMTPYTVTSPYAPESPESMGKIIRDQIRAIIWLVTGRTGASLNERIERYK
ncbi:MAG: YdcF family protein [Microcystaceae cyanobacterium]